MQDYLYDGTFEGFLTCVYHHYYTEQAAGICLKEEYQSSLMGGFQEVHTDLEKADRVYQAIRRKISYMDLRRIYKCFLSTVPDKEMILLRYIVLGFHIGSGISKLHGNPDVFAAQEIEKKINVEAERMRQFVRFSVMQGDILYARIEPDHDVLELIGDHFSDRFRNDPFLIHDVRRGKAMAGYQGKWYITSFAENDVPEESEEEKEYQTLWQKYFDHIAIKERKNSNCQRNFMPLRYRKHLTECQMR